MPAATTDPPPATSLRRAKPGQLGSGDTERTALKRITALRSTAAVALAAVGLTVATVGAGPSAAYKDKNCDDFKSQKQAQKWFKRHGGSKKNNVAGLDANGNGIACEDTAYRVAARGDRIGAEFVASHAASEYVEKFGISYSASSWKTTCEEKGRKWKCSVKTDTGQCGGIVRLRERRGSGFKAYKTNIGCRD